MRLLYRDVESRLLHYRKLNEKTGCIEWVMFLDKNGYGQIRVDGKAYYVHRLVYELQIAPIPKGLYVLHKCNNPKCSNPEHLYLGTQQDNMKDMARAGSMKGHKNSQARLSESDVRSILDDKYKTSAKKLSVKYGVSAQHISDIRTGKRWSHLQG